MKHRETSFSLIFAFVIAAHVGVIGWLIFGQSGCQQEVAASESAPPKDSAVVQLNLGLPDRVAESSVTNQGTVRGDAAQPNTQDDPESRLTLPKSPLAQVPPPEPIVVDDTAEKEREAERKREDAKQAALLAQQRKRAEEAEARLLEAERAKEREVAAAKAEMERVAQKALAEQRERERALAAREAAANRQTEQEREAEAKRLEEQRVAEAKLAEERKRQEIKAALQREVARKLEEDRIADAARARQAAEAAEAARERRLVEERAAKARAEEARILAESLERLERERAQQVAEAQRIVRAKEVAPPPIVSPNIVGEAGGRGQVPVVPARPVGGATASPAPGEVDMAGYRSMVEKMIRSRWTEPKGITVNRPPEVVLRINRSGKVVYRRLSQPSGNPNLDRSVINAVRIGSRLIPLPPGYDKNLYEVKVKFKID